MKCKRCENIISVFKPPFGAYFCKGDHAQCAECDLVSSYCIVCGEATKYKSPHFIDENTNNPEDLQRSKLQIPFIRNILPTKEEEAEFQKVRHEYTIGKPKFYLGLKTEDEVGAVRTLSAIVAKNLYTSNEEESNTEIAESSSHELRLQRVIRTLRETRFPIDEAVAKENSKSCEQTSKIFSNLLTPTHSKLTPTGHNFSAKIHVNIEANPESIKEAERTQGDDKAYVCKKLKSLVCPHLVQEQLLGFPLTIEATSLDRRPFACPLGNCGCKIFISELNHHITLDHSTMPLLQLKVGQFREFSIDFNCCEHNFGPLSLVGFLLKNVVINFGASPLKDVLPIFLMVGRYTACEVLDKPKATNSVSQCIKPWSKKDFFLIWIAGVVPDQCEIVASISVFSQENSTQSIRWYVDKLNSIQAIKDIETTFNGCERLVLSYPELKLLTNNFKDMLQCQVGVISCKLKTV